MARFAICCDGHFMGFSEGADEFDALREFQSKFFDGEDYVWLQMDGSYKKPRHEEYFFTLYYEPEHGFPLSAMPIETEREIREVSSPSGPYYIWEDLS